jgi:hypothetical protein
MIVAWLIDTYDKWFASHVWDSLGITGLGLVERIASLFLASPSVFLFLWLSAGLFPTMPWYLCFSFFYLSSSPPPSRCSLSLSLSLCTVTTERIASSGKWNDSHWRLHHCCQWSGPTHTYISVGMYARLHHVNVQALPAPSQSLAETLQ